MTSIEQQLESFSEQYTDANFEQPSTSFASDSAEADQKVELIQEKKTEEFKFLDDTVLEELYKIWNNYSEMFHNSDDENDDIDVEETPPVNDQPISVATDLVPAGKLKRPQVWTFHPTNIFKNNVCRHMSPLVQAEVFGQYGMPDFCFSCGYKFGSKNSKRH